MTKEEAERQFRRHCEQKAREMEWLNNPQSWVERDRPLTPAELEFAMAQIQPGRWS